MIRNLSSEYYKAVYHLVRDKSNVVAPPSQVKVLEAIMVLHRRGPVTIRKIAKHVGYSAINHVAFAVRQLRKKGLISFEDRQASTIVPRVRFVPAKDLLWQFHEKP